jgi:hypothetical protein
VVVAAGQTGDERDDGRLVDAVQLLEPAPGSERHPMLEAGIGRQQDVARVLSGDRLETADVGCGQRRGVGDDDMAVLHGVDERGLRDGRGVDPGVGCKGVVRP